MPTTPTIPRPAATHSAPTLFASATVAARVRYGSGDWVVRPVSDRILVTMLFTDIVGSTQRAAELGDRRWGELLAQFNRLVECDLGHHRGRLVKSTGDGVVAIFDPPARVPDLPSRLCGSSSWRSAGSNRRSPTTSSTTSA